MKVCYILSYRAPNYVRTTSIVSALKLNKNINLFPCINTNTGLRRYFETISSLIKTKRKHDPDIYILGFRGHEIFWLVRLITRGKPLIFDSLMSPYHSLWDDKKFGALGKIVGFFVFFFEKKVLNSSDFIFTDTQAHISYLHNTFSIPEIKIAALPVGSSENKTGTKSPATPNNLQHLPADRLKVLFYGSFLPLHGIDVLTDLINQCINLPICFIFIGGKGKPLRKFLKAIDNSPKNCVTHIPWVEYDELVNNIIPNVDIGLGGPFGNTPQAQKVITGKTSQFLSQGITTVVGKVDCETSFLDRDNCLLVNQGCSSEIRRQLEWACSNKHKLPSIGIKGHDLYQRQLSIKKIDTIIQEVLENVNLQST